MKCGRYSEFTIGHLDGFLLLLDLQPAESCFLERCLRGEQCLSPSLVLNSFNIQHRSPTAQRGFLHEERLPHAT